MITPDEIRDKADRLYPQVVQAWLNDEEFFPHTLRASKKLTGEFAQDAAAVQLLRAGSHEVRGFGYAVEWRTSRTCGRFPRCRTPS